MRKLCKYLVLPLMTMAMFVFPSFAAEYETEVVNGIHVGDITIGLEEYTIDKDTGNEVPWENVRMVMPGEVVDKIVKIDNLAEPAWIRAKVEYTSESGIEGLDDSMLHISDPRWTKSGDYFYYTEPVEKGTIEFIDTVTVPYEWDSDYANKGFSIVITAEAVQERNFTPDFTTEDPWFGTIIETCVHSDYNKENVKQDNFVVAFENGSDGFIKTGDDFFSNFGTLMPGDTVSDTVEIANHYKRNVQITFSTDYEETSDEIVRDLLTKITLTIQKGEEEIYKGPLAADALKDGIVLKTYRPGDAETLRYELSVPAELNNKYALSDAKVKWIFKASFNDASRSSGSSTGSSISSSDPTPKRSGSTGPSSELEDPDELVNIEDPAEVALNAFVNKIEELTGIELPKTGDSFSLVLMVVVMASALAVMVGILFVKRKSKPENNGKKSITHS